MQTVTVQFKGRTLTKRTKRTDVTHVLVCLHNGEHIICGLHKSRAHADKDAASVCNPAFSEPTVVAVREEGAQGVESGLTGPDWEPTASTRYYAQLGTAYAFGRTEAEALARLAATTK